MVNAAVFLGGHVKDLLDSEAEALFRDVAAALDISQEAAKKRAQRALRRVRTQWLARQQQATRRPAEPNTLGRQVTVDSAE